jgi:hypothetical protein
MKLHPFAQAALILVAGVLAAFALTLADDCCISSNTTTILKGDRR